MSDAADYDPDWWKKRRDESLERKKAEAVKASGVNMGDAFLVVTEGTVTEPVYFELLLNDMELSRVWIKVIPGWASDPRHIVEMAKRVADKQVQLAKREALGIREPPKFDHVWAVIDTDVAVQKGIWSDVVQLALTRKVRLAHSTPCFEYWLLLHLVEHPTTRADLPDGTAAKAAVKKALGRDYSTNEETAREAIRTFVGEWLKAVVHAERVRRHHHRVATPRPGNPSTEVDLLVRALNASLPEHLRKGFPFGLTTQAAPPVLSAEEQAAEWTKALGDY